LQLASFGRRFTGADGTVRATIWTITLGRRRLILLQEESSIGRFECLIHGALGAVGMGVGVDKDENPSENCAVGEQRG
jgi:hypothetical protein